MSPSLSSEKPAVFFIHGLNTFGDDRFHVGPLALGPMYSYWKPFFENSGFDFYSVDEMGRGALEDQAARAAEQILSVVRERSSLTKVHLFGHSMGGLVARGTAALLLKNDEFQSRASLRSVMTIGSPHRGTAATGDALDLRKQSPNLYRALKLFGYDIEKRRAPLSYFSLEKLQDFDRRHPHIESVRCVSFVGSVPKARLGLPLRLIYSKLHPDGEASDGLISAATQEWAHVGGVFELDHFAELGVFLQVRARDRARASREFGRFNEAVKEIIESTSRP